MFVALAGVGGVIAVAAVAVWVRLGLRRRKDAASDYQRGLAETLLSAGLGGAADEVRQGESRPPVPPAEEIPDIEPGDVPGPAWTGPAAPAVVAGPTTTEPSGTSPEPTWPNPGELDAAATAEARDPVDLAAPDPADPDPADPDPADPDRADPDPASAGEEPARLGADSLDGPVPHGPSPLVPTPDGADGHSPTDPVHTRDIDRRWIAWLAKYL